MRLGSKPNIFGDGYHTDPMRKRSLMFQSDSHRLRFFFLHHTICPSKNSPCLSEDRIRMMFKL